MKIPKALNRFLSELYLRRRGVEWRGEVPLINILNPPQFAVYGKLVFGTGVKLFTHLGPTFIQVDTEATITIGNHTVLNNGIWIRATKTEVVIEDYVLVGPRVAIFDSHLHPVHPDDTRAPRPVKLGRNSWIGLGSTILPGVHIGEHSIVGAGSLVTKNVPPRTVVAGNPARRLRAFTCDDDWIRMEIT